MTTMITKNEQIKKDPKAMAGKVVLSPRITEKAAIGSEKGTYVFNVAKTANKSSVIASIKVLHKVTPVDVRFINSAGKRVWSKGQIGRTVGGKKAYVTLKKGDKIEFA